MPTCAEVPTPVSVPTSPVHEKERRKEDEKGKDQNFDLGGFVFFPMELNRSGGGLSTKADPHDHSLECGGRK